MTKTPKQGLTKNGTRKREGGADIPESQRISGKMMALRLPPEMIAALRELATKEGTSVNALGREAIASLLSARGATAAPSASGVEP